MTFVSLLFSLFIQSLSVLPCPQCFHSIQLAWNTQILQQNKKTISSINPFSIAASSWDQGYGRRLTAPCGLLPQVSLSWNKIHHHLKTLTSEIHCEIRSARPTLRPLSSSVSWGFAVSGTCLFAAWEQPGSVWERKQAAHCCCTTQLAVSCADNRVEQRTQKLFDTAGSSFCCFIIKSKTSSVQVYAELFIFSFLTRNDTT